MGLLELCIDELLVDTELDTAGEEVGADEDDDDDDNDEDDDDEDDGDGEEA